MVLEAFCIGAVHMAVGDYILKICQHYIDLMTCLWEFRQICNLQLSKTVWFHFNIGQPWRRFALFESFLVVDISKEIVAMNTRRNRVCV